MIGYQDQTSNVECQFILPNYFSTIPYTLILPQRQAITNESLRQNEPAQGFFHLVMSLYNGAKWDSSCTISPMAEMSVMEAKRWCGWYFAGNTGRRSEGLCRKGSGF